MQFCTKCKSMMFPKDGNYQCRKCGNIIPIENNAQNFVSKAKIDDHEVVVLEGEQTSGLPTTNAKCPECGNNSCSLVAQAAQVCRRVRNPFLKMYQMRVHLERIRLKLDCSSIPPLKSTLPGKVIYQVRASLLLQAEPEAFLFSEPRFI